MSDQTQYIQSVQLTESGYLVNGNMSVPNDPGNRHYNDVQAWIAEGNTPTPIPVPTEEEILAQWRATADCSRLQAKIALEAAGLLDTVEMYLTIDPDVPFAAKLAWKEAYRFSRRSPLFDLLGPALSMTPEQIDDLFRAAQAVEV